MTSTERIVELSDVGEHPAAIADALGVSLSRVYKVLQRHQPDRERAPRPASGQQRMNVTLDLKTNKCVADIVKSRKCTRAYVHRIKRELGLVGKTKDGRRTALGEQTP